MLHISRSKISQKKKGPEKKGRDPGLQSTEGGRFGHHPVPASLKQRNNGTYTQQEQYNIQQLQWTALIKLSGQVFNGGI